jgi:hypothetical protein
MALLFIDFEWWKDAKGYHLADPEPATPIGSRTDPTYGFGIGPSLLESVGKPQRVVPNGGKRIACRPLEKFDKLFRAFASIKSADDLLQFIKQFGPLTEAGLLPDRGENVPFVLEHAESFRKWLDANHRSRKDLAAWIGQEGKKFANLEASLTTDASGEVHLRVLPRSLLGALWLQLAHTLAGGTKIRSCVHCGKWFDAGPGTARRLDAKFCSDDHRVLYNSLKRSKGG